MKSKLKREPKGRFARDIKWETDGADATGLPESVRLPAGMEDDDVVEWLSATYGYLVSNLTIGPATVKKYAMIDENRLDGLLRLKALRSFGSVQKAALGGLVASEANLSHEGDCWVYGDARVYGGACVSGDASVYGDANVYGSAKVSGNAQVYGNAVVYGDASVSGNAVVYGDVIVYGNVSGDAQVYGSASVSGKARVSGDARVYGYASVSGNAIVSGDAQVYGSASVSGSAKVSGNAKVYGYALVSGDANISDTRHYMVFSGLGSEGRHCTLFRTKTGHRLNVGCWSGTLDEFETRVRAVRGDGSDYLQALPLLRYKASEWHPAEAADK